MSGEILNRIDAVVGGLCPCGAEPAAGSAWCSEDCRPVPGAGRAYLGETWTMDGPAFRVPGAVDERHQWHTHVDLCELEPIASIIMGESLEQYQARRRDRTLETTTAGEPEPRPNDWVTIPLPGFRRLERPDLRPGDPIHVTHPNGQREMYVVADETHRWTDIGYTTDAELEPWVPPAPYQSEYPQRASRRWLGLDDPARHEPDPELIRRTLERIERAAGRPHYRFQ